MDIALMPYSRKYARVAENTQMIKSLTTDFMMKRVGEEAASEFMAMLEKCNFIEPENPTVKDKYETAYENWICTVRNAYALAKGRLDENGFKDFKHADVEAFKKLNAGPAMVVLSVIRAVAPGKAFKLAMKELAYQFQWLTPFSVTELTGRRTTLDIPHCKVLNYPNVGDICHIRCQQVYPMWFAEQFGADMRFNRTGTSCKCTIERMG